MLADQVADNDAENSVVESESLLFGTGFGVSTDIQTGPGGGLFVVSTSAGSVYEIYRVQVGWRLTRLVLARAARGGGRRGRILEFPQVVRPAEPAHLVEDEVAALRDVRARARSP